MQIYHFSSQSSGSASWLSFLGLREDDSSHGLHVRRARLIELRRRAAPRLCLTALAMISLYLLQPDARRLDGWMIAAAVIAIISNLIHFRKIRAAAHLNTLSEAAMSLGAGLLWATGALGYGAGGEPSHQLAIVLIFACWMLGMAGFLAAAPLAALALIVPAGGGLVAMLGVNGMTQAALLAAGFWGILILSQLRQAHILYARFVDNAALSETRDMLGLVLREFDEAGGNWVWEVDAARNLKNVSGRFADALGQPISALEGCPFLPVLAGSAWDSGNVSNAIQELAEKLRKRERFSGLLLPFERDGETRWWEFSALPCTDAAGAFAGFRGLGCDVTEAHRAVDRINRMAKFDALTGLPNRVHLLEALEQAIIDAARQRARCSVLLIDLDRFKAVNDTFGHPVGDQLLMQVAARLRTLASNDVVFGRLGGDEFAAVIPDVRDPARVAALAQQIVESLSAPYDVNRHRLMIGASVGAAFSPRDGRTADMLLRSADLALYQSKEEGGGSYHAYEPRFLQEAEERRLVEIALQNALESGEFSIVYQPTVDTMRDEIISLEAELRWSNASLGEVPPARFIPVAQDTRLIIPIGDWLLKSACLEAASWPSSIGLSVKVTAEQLIDSGLANNILLALTQSSLPAQRLTIDVTEEALQKSGEQGLLALEQLVALGVRLSLSDFGPAGAALGHFSRTRFGTVRLHPALVQGASKEGRDSIAVLRAVMTLADNLGMTAVAQGVDDDRQFHAVQTLGCRLMQGSLLGPPLAADQVRPRWERRGSDKAVA